MQQALEYLAAKKQGFDSTRSRKDLKVKDNGRSADFIIPSFAVGCELACSYCYVARHRPFGNPVHAYANREAIWKATLKHYRALASKQPNQCHPRKWTYDIGESTDCLSPAVVAQTNWFISQFGEHTDAVPTFATKISTGPKFLLPVKVQGQARVRISLMPQHVATVVEVGTSRINARIKSINELVAMGYEVHVNFSPVIVYKGWVEDYRALMLELRETLTRESLAQLKAEVIFLTHHGKSHENNLQWLPEAEELLWTPQWQELKVNDRGDNQVLRYTARRVKPAVIQAFRKLMSEVIPECELRYIF